MLHNGLVGVDVAQIIGSAAVILGMHGRLFGSLQISQVRKRHGCAACLLSRRLLFFGYPKSTQPDSRPPATDRRERLLRFVRGLKGRSRLRHWQLLPLKRRKGPVPLVQAKHLNNQKDLRRRFTYEVLGAPILVPSSPSARENWYDTARLEPGQYSGSGQGRRGVIGGVID
jgi:hypothetical protein